jgi:hypothetical protein
MLRLPQGWTVRGFATPSKRADVPAKGFSVFRPAGEWGMGARGVPAPAGQGSFSLIGNQVNLLHLGSVKQRRTALACLKFSVNFCKVFACNIS